MITEDYCSYEVAKLLKEKGFDEPCLQVWECGPDKKYLFRLQSSCYQNITEKDSCLAPTHQMAMKWLREEYNIFIQISAVLQDQPFGLHYRPSIQDYHAYARHDNFSEYVTYEEAVEVVLKYCLENLI